jgi:hypothetical protein
MAILAIGATIVFGLNRDVVKQADGIRSAQSRMEVLVVPP